ncbi:MAG: pyruvate kinase [bacterium]
MCHNFYDNMTDLLRNTKIIATFGPAVASSPIAERVLQEGADVIRLNFSHGSYESHAQSIRLIRELAEKHTLPVSILLDLQGPKIRTGAFKEGKHICLKEGEHLIIMTTNQAGEPGKISTDYKGLASDLKAGAQILLDDGAIELRVTKIDVESGQIYTDVIVGGMLGEHKGMNFPDSEIKLPSLTEKDKKDLEFGLAHGVDYIALSFVREAMDIEVIKAHMRKYGDVPPVIAKIETPQAVKNIDEILQKAEGVMVARGDLGVEMNPKMVPIVQKMIVKKACEQSRIVIIATQMLDSMIRNPRPTRAEVSDVANAIFDGADAIMLSGETSIGKYPLGAIKMMSEVAFVAEENRENYSIVHIKDGAPDNMLPERALAHSACYVAERVKAKAIVVYTSSGKTALYISKQRPNERIIAITPFQKIYSRMNLYWNVTPLMCELGNHTGEMIKIGDEALVKKGVLNEGDCIIVVAGSRLIPGSTNMIKIHFIGKE